MGGLPTSRRTYNFLTLSLRTSYQVVRSTESGQENHMKFGSKLSHLILHCRTAIKSTGNRPQNIFIPKKWNCIVALFCAAAMLNAFALHAQQQALYSTSQHISAISTLSDISALHQTAYANASPDLFPGAVSLYFASLYTDELDSNSVSLNFFTGIAALQATAPMPPTPASLDNRSCTGLAAHM